MKSHLLSFVFAILSLSAIGQGIVVDSLGVAVNENEASADPSAILDVSSNSKGLLIPRVTNTEMNAIQNPAQGLIVYNTTNSSFYYYKGSIWSDLAEISDIPSDGDRSSTNELITNFWVEDSKDQLVIAEGKDHYGVELSQISPWKIEADKELFTRVSDARVAIGRDTVMPMDDAGGPFKGQYPKVDICTGDSEGKEGFLDLLSLYHSKCGELKVPRRLGLNLSLRKELIDKYLQDGGLFIESHESFGAKPMLKIYLMEHEAINIMQDNEFRVGIHTDRPECAFFVNGQSGGTTAWQQFSDSRLKQNVQQIDSALNIVENMRGVYFEWKADSVYSRPEGQQIGFIAQELQPYLPQVVGDTTTSRYMTVSYASITPVLAEAIKELKAQKDSEIEALNAELEAKDTELQQLRSMVEALQTAVETLQENSDD